MNPASKPSPTLLVSLALGVAALLIWVMSRRSESGEPASPSSSADSGLSSTSAVVAVVSPVATPRMDGNGTAAPLVGERILQGYASGASTAENDLTLMARLMDNFTLLVKDAADRPLSANEDWASAFRGVNPARERFLNDQHVALNPKGQLVDRWGTPLNFHSLGGRRYEIRSAGPDGKLWTEDDIHRNADGSFRKGTNLMTGDLLDTAADRERR